MKDLHPSLLAAALSLAGPAPDASWGAWRAWRDQADIQALSWPEIQFLPLLHGPRLHAWLANDEAAGVLRGIVRRAWAEAQVRLALAQDLSEMLARAGCGPVTMTGSAGLHLRNRPRNAIRPISGIELLISRDSLHDAAELAMGQGWQLYGEMPAGEALDWCRQISLHRDGASLLLQWRVLNVPPDLARGCEAEFLRSVETIEVQGCAWRILDATHALLEALAKTAAPNEADTIPWQADCALLLHEGIDWERCRLLAQTYHPSAFDRLANLRELGLAVPALLPALAPGLGQDMARETVSRAPMRHYAAGLRRWVRRARKGARRLLPAGERV
jgi:hypothetical protein